MNYISYWEDSFTGSILEGDMEEFVIKSMIDNGFI